MRVVVIGAGYVGLCTGMTLAYFNNQVTFIDVDKEKIEKLKNGIIPLYEPGLKELLELSKENIVFRSDYHGAVQNAEIVFITVGTPAMDNGFPDMRYVKNVACNIGENIIDENTIIINKSTAPIGSANWIETLITDAFESKNGRALQGKLTIISNPEFLKEGSAVFDSFFPNRIVIGFDNTNLIQKVYDVYQQTLEQSFTPPPFLCRPEGLKSIPLVITDLATAELIKYSANSYLSLKISFINEIACVAEKVGADIKMIAEGIGLDERIGNKFLNAGIGWGGSCFSKDTAALIATANEYGLEMPIIKAAREVNYFMRERILEKLLEHLKIIKGKTIGILGLAFKANTDDIRDAPSIDIIKKLVSMGVKVVVHDPVVKKENVLKLLGNCEVIFVNQINEIFENTDGLILVTEWPEYREIPWEKLAEKMSRKIVFDGRNFLDEERLSDIGIKHIGVGR